MKPIEICHLADVSTKEIVTDVLDRLPDSASLKDVARELEFEAAIQVGFDELDRGLGVPVEEVEKMLPKWIEEASR